MITIGLTGNVGSGKSTVAQLLERWGATVVDTDVLAREVVVPGSPALARIRELWGDDVIDADGSLDRGAMRRIVFADPGARRRLETILHPPIMDRCRDRIAQARARRVAYAVAVVPLLFEADLADEFDLTLLVDAPLEQRIMRLVEDRGLPESEARAIAAAQMPAEEKRARADFIIDNDSDLTTLERRAWETWKEIEKLAGGSSN